MSEEKTNDVLSKWFSTYGLITAERLLATYHIRLAHEDLLVAIKNPQSIFYRILKDPVRNVLNGIILTQAQDYQVYLQKLFIDYLLSGESSKDESSPGAQTREKIEDDRKEFVSLGEDFFQVEKKHTELIADSQAYLIDFTKKWQVELEKTLKSCKKLLADKSTASLAEYKKACFAALSASAYSDLYELTPQSAFMVQFQQQLSLSIDEDKISDIIQLFRTFSEKFKGFDEQLSQYYDQALEIAETLRSYRKQFYDSILRVTEELTNLSDYNMDKEQVEVNKQALYFDREIG